MSGFSRGFADGFSKRIEKLPGVILLSVYAAGQDEMKETVKNIVEKWFAPAPMKQGLGSMISTFQYKASFVNKSKGTRITYSAWSVPDAFQIGGNAIGWAHRHGYSEGQMKIFVYNLLMFEGIIGLPEYASVWQANHGYPYTNPQLGWSEGHNMRFFQREPLSIYLYYSVLWKNWETKMVKAVEQAANSIDL